MLDQNRRRCEGSTHQKQHALEVNQLRVLEIAHEIRRYRNTQQEKNPKIPNPTKLSTAISTAHDLADWPLARTRWIRKMHLSKEFGDSAAPRYISPRRRARK